MRLVVKLLSGPSEPKALKWFSRIVLFQGEFPGTLYSFPFSSFCHPLFLRRKLAAAS
jgi:hypothetical protein